MVRNQSEDQRSKPKVEIEAVREEKTQDKVCISTMNDACPEESWHGILHQN